MANAKPAFQVEVDSARNLVRTHYRGHLTGPELAAGRALIEKRLVELRPGFAVLADLSELDSMDLECGPHLSRIMDLCRVRGVGLVMRVIPDPTKDIGINILSIIHYRGKVPIMTCTTLAEAERKLTHEAPESEP